MSNTNKSDNGIEILVKLIDSGPATLNDLGVSRFRINALLEDEAVKVAGTVKHTDDEGKAVRGRPARQFGLTDKGRKRAKRHLKNAEQAAQASEPEAQAA